MFNNSQMLFSFLCPLLTHFSFLFFFHFVCLYIHFHFLYLSFLFFFILLFPFLFTSLVFFSLSFFLFPLHFVYPFTFCSFSVFLHHITRHLRQVKSPLLTVFWRVSSEDKNEFLPVERVFNVNTI